MVRSSLWEKATREFDPHLPEKIIGGTIRCLLNE